MAYTKLGALIERVNSTVTSGGTLTLANNSPSFQRFTGTTTHIVVLPQANAASPSECPVGLKFTILNRSTGAVTVNYNGGTLAATVSAGSQTTFRLTDNSTSLGTWDITVESGSSGSATLTSQEKLAAIAALANSYYQDSQTDSNILNINPEELGGNYWLTKQSVEIANGIRNQAMAVLNNIMYSVGGDDGGGPGGVSQPWNYAFNDDNNAWVGKTGLSTAKNGLGVFSINGSLFAGGGRTTSTNTSTAIQSYSDSSNSWTTSSATLPTAKSNMPNNMVYNDLAYFIGGYVTGGATSSDVSVFSPTANAAYARTSLPAARYDGSGLVGPKYLYYVVGVDSSFNRTTTNYAYDPILNNWKTMATAFPQARNGSQAYTSLDRGYIASGYTNGGSPTTQQYQYNFEIDLWETTSTISTARYDAPAGGCQFNGLGYVLGGSSTGGPLLNTMESFVPFSFISVNIAKKSTTSPTSIFSSAAINNLVTSVPARIRTDGDKWRYITANADSVLKGSGVGVSEGAELVTNGDFATNLSGWTLNNLGASTTTWQSPGYALLSRNNNQQDFYQTISTVTGQRYRLAFDVSTVTGGGGLYVEAQDGTSVAPGGSPNIGSINGITADGTYYLEFIARSANTILNFHMEVQAVCSCRLDNVSCKAVAANGVQTFNKFTRSPMPYSATGSDGSSALSTNESYKPNQDVWLTRQAVTAARIQACGYNVDGIGYVVAGQDNGSVLHAEQYAYDEIANTWTTKASVVSAFRAGVGGSYNGYGYYVSPASVYTSDSTNRLAKYDATANSFSTKANPSQESRQGCLYNQAGYLWSFGGAASVGGSELTTNYRYSDEVNTWIAKTASPAGKYIFAGFALNGKNYAAGGQSGGSQINTTFSYNPGTDTWSTGEGNLPYSAYHLNGFVHDGYGYSTGGFNGASSALFSQYNPYSLTWTNKTAAGIRQNAASGYYPAPYYNYQLQVGLPTYLAAVGRGQWTTKTSMPQAKTSGGSFALGSNLYCCDGNGGTQLELIKYDPIIDSWTYETNFIYANQECPSMNLAVNGLGHRFGDGAAATNQLHYRYEALTKTWINSTPYPTLIYQQSAACLNSLTYGFAGNRPGVGLVTTNYSYSDSTNSWTSRAATLATSQDSTGSAYNGFMYVTGQGSRHDQYNDAANSWLAKTSLGNAGNGQAMFLSQGRLVAAGDGPVSAVVKWYSDSLNLWTSLASLPASRGGAFNGSYNDTGYIFGGSNGVTNQSTTYAYTPTIKNVVLGAGLRIS